VSKGERVGWGGWGGGVDGAVGKESRSRAWRMHSRGGRRHPACSLTVVHSNSRHGQVLRPHPGPGTPPGAAHPSPWPRPPPSAPGGPAPCGSPPPGSRSTPGAAPPGAGQWRHTSSGCPHAPAQ
jgi:hypothetical protein